MPARKRSQGFCAKAGGSGDAGEGSPGRHGQHRRGFAESHPENKATAGRKGAEEKGKKKKKSEGDAESKGSDSFLQR